MKEIGYLVGVALVSMLMRYVPLPLAEKIETQYENNN
jgi:hypothetical protein